MRNHSLKSAGERYKKGERLKTPSHRSFYRRRRTRQITMKFLIVCLALISAACAQHLNEGEVRARCLVDKPDTAQGVEYVADLDCAYFWQCDFAETELYNITLHRCATGSLWNAVATTETRPAVGQEKVVCIPCELQANPICQIQHPLGSPQCPLDPTQAPTTTEAYPDLGTQYCVNPVTGHQFHEIAGEDNKVWDMGANGTYDCDYLIFNFDPTVCNCASAPLYPMFWPFVDNFNSFGNRIFADQKPTGSASILEDGCAEFNGTGGLQIPFFKFQSMKENWVVGLVFERDGDQRSTLVYRTPNIYIDGDRLFVEAVVKNGTDAEEALSVSVFLPPGMVSMIAQWDGFTLTVTTWAEDGTVNQNSATVSYLGSPWALFYPAQEPLFVAYVTPDYVVPNMPGAYSGKICFLYFTDKSFINEGEARKAMGELQG